MITLIKWYIAIWNYVKENSLKFRTKAILAGIAFYFTTLVALFVASFSITSDFKSTYLPFITSNNSYWMFIFLAPLVIMFLGIVILILLIFSSLLLIYLLYIILFPWIMCYKFKKYIDSQEKEKPLQDLKAKDSSSSVIGIKEKTLIPTKTEDLESGILRWLK